MADHRQYRAEVRPRRHGAEGQRQVRPEDHRGEDRRRRPEEDHRHRGPEEDQRAQAEDPEEGRTAPVRQLGAAMAAPSNTLADRVRTVFADIVCLLRSRAGAERRSDLPARRRGAEGSEGMAFGRRPVLGRRAATARLARCSRWVRGKSRANEFRVGPEVRSIRPPRLLPDRRRSAGRDRA